MSPFDTEDDDSGLSFNELPPSMRAQQAPAYGFTIPTGVRPNYLQLDTTGGSTAPTQQAQPAQQPQGGQGYTYMPPPSALPGAQTGLPLAPIGQAGQGQIYTPAVPQQPSVVPQPPPAKDNSAMMFILATAVLGGLGYWAYTKMEKDRRKIRVGPPAGQTADYGDDDDDSDRDDDHGESAAPLDDYEDAGLPEKDVDPHEEGGIKLVKG